MNSIGVFLEKEIDGRTVFSFSLLSELTQTTSSSSSEDLLLLQPLFLCPSLRRRLQNAKHLEKNTFDNMNFLQWDTSPQFPCTRSDDELISYFFDYNNPICKLPLLPLFWCNNKKPYSDEFQCGACQNSNHGEGYYSCSTCNLMFHKECVECPLEIRQHPSYPFLSFKLYTPPAFSASERCFCCGIYLIYSNAYHCLTYKVSMHPVCAMKSIPFLIDHPKIHHHSLSLFPKQTSLCCDVCGLINLIPTYICVRCVFVVHQDCIYSPHVIRISRHHHRLYFNISLSTGKWVCGICRRKVDTRYGGYSCNKCSGYFVHTRCALRRDVWDGEDLEGVPEEPEINVDPFETIAEGVIHHFSHDHHLKLEMSRVYDEDKICQACILPIYQGNYYSCVDHQCEFILHEACANAPRMKRHPLHSHPLTLKVVSSGFDDNTGFFRCSACQRKSCSFVYEVILGPYQLFRLDIRCASISEPFEYQGHPHPLFLALTPEEEISAKCQVVCQGENKYCRKLNCIECEYVICFWCATLPYKAKYKHDKHLLTFREREEESDHSYWCEVCEREIEYSKPGGFYACDACCTTLHIHCLIGKDPYMMKLGQTVTTSGYYRSNFQIISNKTMSRPFCHYHSEGKDRCPYRTVFKNNHMTFCSHQCANFRSRLA